MSLHTTRNNVSGTLLAISKFGWYRQLSLLTHAHVQETLVPTFDDLSYTQLEGEWLIPVQATTRKEKQFYLNLHCIHIHIKVNIYFSCIDKLIIISYISNLKKNKLYKYCSHRIIVQKNLIQILFL